MNKLEIDKEPLVTIDDDGIQIDHDIAYMFWDYTETEEKTLKRAEEINKAYKKMNKIKRTVNRYCDELLTSFSTDAKKENADNVSKLRTSYSKQISSFFDTYDSAIVYTLFSRDIDYCIELYEGIVCSIDRVNAELFQRVNYFENILLLGTISKKINIKARQTLFEAVRQIYQLVGGLYLIEEVTHTQGLISEINKNNTDEFLATDKNLKKLLASKDAPDLITPCKDGDKIITTSNYQEVLRAHAKRLAKYTPFSHLTDPLRILAIISGTFVIAVKNKE